MRVRLAAVNTAVFILPILGVLSVPSRAIAQQYAINEVTVGANFQTYRASGCIPIGSGPQCNLATYHYLSYPTFSATYTYNLSSSLALEGTVNPTSQFLRTNGYGSGRETLALGGVKTGWRGHNWGFYGKVQVGVGSFGCGYFTYDPTAYSDCKRVTNFALEYGGVVERRLSKRWALRLDAAHLMMPQFDRILVRYQDGSPYYSQEAQWLQGLDARIGITRSFGALHEAQQERVPEHAAWDAGVLFALQPRYLPDWPFMNVYPTWGLWGSWNFSKHFSWDSAVMHSGRNSGNEFIDLQAGGRAFQALTGLKMGIRRDHMGYFAKVRGGTITFGETERQGTFLPNGSFKFDNGMFTNPVLDLGGVYEVYPSRHFVLRADAGSATIFYQPKNVIQLGQTYAIPGRKQTGMLLGFGAGFRF